MRERGYANIEDYAILADGRATALVAKDGSVDWLAQPTMDQPATFAALLDPERGGRMSLQPAEARSASRRYLPHTNVLETTFTTAGGTVKIQDALTQDDGGLMAWLELARQIDCVAGAVTLRWRVEPRFDFGRQEPQIRLCDGVALARGGRSYLAVLSFDAGEPQVSADAVFGELTLKEGQSALLALVGVDNEPIPLPSRAEIEERLKSTARHFKSWTARSRYQGPWAKPVERSALALKSLIYTPSGAMEAAATTGLPEIVSGERNYDYRFAWIRDSAFSLDALGRLGYRDEVHGSLSWLLAATEATHPRMEPLYALDGSVPAATQELPLRGWRGTGPVKQGNAASGQLQLGTYGDLLETIRLYCFHGNLLDEETATRVVEVCDFVCGIWRNEDSGFWELPERRHYTESKMAVWGALDRALGLYEMGQISPGEESLDRWRQTQAEIRDFIESECWSEALQSYTFSAGSAKLDAAVLLNARIGYVSPDEDRFVKTIDAIRDGLSAGGPLLYRFSDMRGEEGAFVACSFWLVTALARAGRLKEAREQMESILKLANDVGLYSEEIEPASGSFRGNFPQALSHLALIDAACIYHEINEHGLFPARAAKEASR